MDGRTNFEYDNEVRKLSSSTKFILKSFIPYTDANISLAISPAKFFYELEKRSKIKERTLRSTYYRSIKQGMIEVDDSLTPRLTTKGLAKIEKYKPAKLNTDAHLLVIFDIPESERDKRRHLRLLLRELAFQKIQQSVWASPFDHRKYLTAEIKYYNLERYVIVYEAAKLKII